MAPVTAPTACPACGAAVRPDSPWCTLCYADLRPKPEPSPLPEPEPEPASPAPVTAAPQPPAVPPPDPLSDPLAPPLVPTPAPAATWPCTTCGAANAMERDTCASCGAGFLAGARNEGPLLELPVVGDITRLSRGMRFALAAAVALGFLLLVLVLGLLFS